VVLDRAARMGIPTQTTAFLRSPFWLAQS
jgi:hypothetical protein